METSRKVKIYQALSNSTRLGIVQNLVKSGCVKNYGRINCDILSQPAVSHHITKLVDAGILKERKDGTSKVYEVNRETLKLAAIDVKSL